MSGPKSSEYVVDAAALRAQENMMQEIEAEIGELGKQLNQLKYKIHGSVKNLQQRLEECPLEHEEVDRIQNLQRQIVDNINQHLKRSPYRSISNLIQHRTRLESQLKTSQTAYSANLIPMIERVKSDIGTQQNIIQGQAFIEAFSREANTKEEKKIQKFMLQPKKLAEDATEKVAGLEEIYRSASQALSSYLNNPLVSSTEELQAIWRGMEDIMANDRLDLHYKKNQLIARKKAFLSTKSKYDKEIHNNGEIRKEFDELYNTYKALCEILEEQPRTYSSSLEGREIHHSINDLKKVIPQQETAISKGLENQYVVESVDEVMNEMGYDVIGKDEIHTPKRNIMHHIYSYGENAINTYVSDNGSIMFEVSGITEEKRIPTALERLKIKEDMERFCESYKTIKEKLKGKGIEITNESLCPPDEKYAKCVTLSSNKRVKKSKVTEERRKKKPTALSLGGD